MQDRREGQLSIMAEDFSIMTSPTEETNNLETVDDIAEKLSLLTFEMADPEQDLSVQQPGYGATTFTCFPKLALELRLTIWRAAFPRGRMVEIVAQLRGHTYYGPPLPSTLMINQESRKETLRHYLLYCQDDELLNRLPGWAGDLRSTVWLEQQSRPICYSPGRDLLFAPFWPPLESSTTALLKLVAEKCKSIGQVRVLATDYFNYRYISTWRALRPNPINFPVLTDFPDLKEIYCCIENPTVGKWHKTDVIEALDEAIDLEREKLPCINKPKISFFDSMRNLEKIMRAQDW